MRDVGHIYIEYKVEISYSLETLYYVLDVKQHNDCQVLNKENNYCGDRITTPTTVAACPSSPDALDDSFRYRIE